MSQGKIVQIIGAVVDVEFPREDVPKMYDALKVKAPRSRSKCSSSWATASCAPSRSAPPTA